jgi:hypothetical protein
MMSLEVEKEVVLLLLEEEEVLEVDEAVVPAVPGT